MSFTSDELLAIARLEDYNGQRYDVTTNPYGFAGTGYQTNIPLAFNDTALTTNAFVREAQATLTATEAARDASLDALSDLLNAMVNGLYTTSTSTVTIGAGSKTFVVADDLADDVKLVVGMWIKAADPSDVTKWMVGTLTAISTGTPDQITISVPSDGFSGSGSVSSWNIIATGQPGPVAPLNKSAYGALPSLASGDTCVWFDASDSDTPKYFSFGSLRDLILSEATVLSIVLGS